MRHLDVDEVMCLLAQLFDAVAELERCGVAHRDIRLSNILLRRRNLGSTGDAQPGQRLPDQGNSSSGSLSQTASSRSRQDAGLGSEQVSSDKQHHSKEAAHTQHTRESVALEFANKAMQIRRELETDTKSASEPVTLTSSEAIEPGIPTDLPSWMDGQLKWTAVSTLHRSYQYPKQESNRDSVACGNIVMSALGS
ncbi:unnamed protein product [Protopolystoma xenopodis]|uniref:Protein kinase domain-containing protein n=1 Tax=Protopolystoma xenopodis TaxID=117903 RepID=A0A448WL69_9PLAT|nr:unnamed protein product [Protopolystoma xenopodis]